MSSPIAFNHNGLIFGTSYEALTAAVATWVQPYQKQCAEFVAKLQSSKPDASGKQDKWVLAYHRSLHKWIVMDKDSSKYGRSLRKFRKKLRFNLAAGIFKPNLFLSLTLDPAHFEEKLKDGEPIKVSAMVRDFFQVLRKKGLNFSYAWRVECGTKRSKRPHVHLLLTLPDKPKIHIKNVWNKEKSKMEKHYVWEYARLWANGKITDAKELLPGDSDSYNMVTNYISKYFSKNSKDGEPEPDPKKFAGQRFNTSRDLIRCPPSCYNKPEETTNRDRVAEIEAEQAKEDGELQKLPEEERKQILMARKLKWMHASYWFEGLNPGTQMRDYVFRRQEDKRIKLVDQKTEKAEESLFWAFVKKDEKQSEIGQNFDELWEEYESNFRL